MAENSFIPIDSPDTIENSGSTVRDSQPTDLVEVIQAVSLNAPQQSIDGDQQASTAANQHPVTTAGSSSSNQSTIAAASANNQPLLYTSANQQPCTTTQQGPAQQLYATESKQPGRATPPSGVQPLAFGTRYNYYMYEDDLMYDDYSDSSEEEENLLYLLHGPQATLIAENESSTTTTTTATTTSDDSNELNVPPLIAAALDHYSAAGTAATSNEQSLMPLTFSYDSSQLIVPEAPPLWSLHSPIGRQQPAAGLFTSAAAGPAASSLAAVGPAAVPAAGRRIMCPTAVFGPTCSTDEQDPDNRRLRRHLVNVDMLKRSADCAVMKRLRLQKELVLGVYPKLRSKLRELRQLRRDIAAAMEEKQQLLEAYMQLRDCFLIGCQLAASVELEQQKLLESRRHLAELLYEQ